jgi:hypothetical protein
LSENEAQNSQASRIADTPAAQVIGAVSVGPPLNSFRTDGFKKEY